MPPFTVTLQTTLDQLVALVHLCNLSLCSPWITLLQIQGSVVGLLLAGGWFWAGLMRIRETHKQRWLTRQRLAQPYSKAQRPGAPLQTWPGVTLVLPVKGCRPHSHRTWQSQFSMTYGGPLEILVVVDSKGDAACAAVQNLIAQDPSMHPVRIVVAPIATTHSQKICNLMTGIMAACGQHKYVLCLDDDAMMHPQSLSMLVHALESDKTAFMSTGYPFDIPPAGSNVLTYCALAYHLPLLIAFSIRQTTPFVWGGCMLLPLADMKADRQGIMKAWRHGGYSDDLTVASVCSQQNLKILCPSFALFPQWLDGVIPWHRYWNYLRRQLFVMDTYTSVSNKRTNHTMMALHTYLSLAFVLPTLTVILRLATWGLLMALLPTQKVWDGPGTSLHWLAMFGASACPASIASLGLFLTSFAAAGLALVWMVAAACALLRELSPHAQPVYAADMFHWGKVWTAFVISNTILPACMLYTVLVPTIEWSGIRYRKSRGIVAHSHKHEEA